MIIRTLITAFLILCVVPPVIADDYNDRYDNPFDEPKDKGSYWERKQKKGDDYAIDDPYNKKGPDTDDPFKRPNKPKGQSAGRGILDQLKER